MHDIAAKRTVQHGRLFFYYTSKKQIAILKKSETE